MERKNLVVYGMIEFFVKAFSFIKDQFSCCNTKSGTAVSPAVVHGNNAYHLSKNHYRICSDNSVNCCIPNKKKGKRRKAPEKDRQKLLEKYEQLSTRPAPEPHPGGGKELRYQRSPNSESSFHSALTTFQSPTHSSTSPLRSSQSPAHTAILRQQGEAGVGTLSLGVPKGPPVGSIILKGKADSTSLVGKGPGDPLIFSLNLIVPKLIVYLLICGVLVELCSAGDLFIVIVQNDINTLTTIEPIKVDLEALAQAQKVGEALGSMQGSEPAERAALEIEQQVSCPHKMALWAAGFLLAAALAYSRYS